MKRKCIFLIPFSFYLFAYLEHFNLAGCRVETLWSRVSVKECLNLNAKWNTFLTAMLLWREFRTDAVHLQTRHISQVSKTLTRVDQFCFFKI